MVTILVAVISSLGLMVSAYIQHVMTKKIDGVDKKVATSNGHTSGELLELLAVDIEKMKASQANHTRQLAEHTAQDEANFQRLEARIKLIAEGAVG